MHEKPFTHLWASDKRLAVPLGWKKPRVVRVNNHASDLFHESLSNEEIAAVFGVMAACPRHTFQVLTKRPKRAAEWFLWASLEAHQDGGPGQATVCGIHASNYGANVDYLGLRDVWPLPNVWLGVSVENQKTADERIPRLLKCQAAVRFVSAEPLLEAVDLNAYVHRSDHKVCPLCMFATNSLAATHCPNDGTRLGNDIALDWVIVGGESGNGARPFDLEWARSVVRQCGAAGVAAFFKQGGASHGCAHDRKGGCFECTPEDLRIREFPRGY